MCESELNGRVALQEVAIMLQPGQSQPPSQVSLTDLALINVPVSPLARVVHTRSAVAPAPGPAPGPAPDVSADWPAGVAMIDSAPGPVSNYEGREELTARVRQLGAYHIATSLLNII